ncbi:MAG: TRAP transporter permease [Firmicutes bacterium]|nr:TRAP transporter permease [Bacillota bacterium]
MAHKGRKIIGIYAIAMSLFHLYTGLFGTLEAMLQRSVHLGFALPLVFLFNPTDKDKKEPGKLDWLLAFVSLIPTLYIIADYQRISTRWAFSAQVTTLDMLIGVLTVLLLLEAARRLMGSVITILISSFLLYAVFGHMLGGKLGHAGYSFSRIIEYLYLTTEGIYGIPLGTSATYVVLFVIFGAFLEQCGTGELFMDLAVTLTGRSRGGPAKAAVMSSALFGTISGAAVANVYGTGTFTIPLMKKIGYDPEFAGAVEAVASAGGQIMPPVMGSAAFIMADMLGIPYFDIVKAAIIPAILYFMCVFVIVDLRAVKHGLVGLKKDQIPEKSQTYARLYLLAPIVGLVITLVLGYTAYLAALVGIGLAIAVSVFHPDNRMGIKDILNALEKGATGGIMVAVAAASSGIIVGIATQTGLGFKFTSMVTSLSGGNVILAGVLVMAAAIVLGMGLPASAAYIMVASLAVPALIQLQVSPLAAHMFVFYFAAISTITPPVAMASYAGASIAGADPMKTGFTGFKLALVAFIVPFFFLQESPALLLQSNPITILIAAITSLVGAVALGGALEGWLISKTRLVESVALFVAAITMLKPGFVSDLCGIVILAAVVLFQWNRNNKELSNNNNVVTGV